MKLKNTKAVTIHVKANVVIFTQPGVIVSLNSEKLETFFLRLSYGISLLPFPSQLYKINKRSYHVTVSYFYS